MRILIVNKFFYPRGGDCIVAMSTREMLLARGHEARVFAMDFPDNVHLPESPSYATQVDFSGPLSAKLKGAARVLGLGDIRKSFAAALDDFRPDVVHLHNIHSYLSPIVASMAAQRGVKVVWTLHDYKLLCPAYSCLRTDGTICTDCIERPRSVVDHRCMKGSLVQSALALLEAKIWGVRKLSRMVDTFIAPSQFMASMLRRGGIPDDKIEVVCNFIDPEKWEIYDSLAGQPRIGGYICYAGRLSREKGVDHLLASAARSGCRLKVAGDGPLGDELRRKYANKPGIEFLGRLDAAEVARLLHGADASVIASQCYENNPLGVIESQCAGTPVIGAAMGGIPELLDAPGCLTFSNDDPDDLSTKLSEFQTLAESERQRLATISADRYSALRHYESLCRIYGMGGA